MASEQNESAQEFVWKVKNGELPEVEAALEKNKSLVNQEFEGRCPLHYAADYGQAEVISCLIAKGADVNKEDKHGITPLLAAIWEQHYKCVQILLKKGAKKDGKAPSGETYLQCAETDDLKLLLK